MQNAKSSKSHSNVFEQLGFSPEESAALTMKAELHSTIIKAIEHRHYTQTDLQARLDEPQPRVSDLMRGKISKFSLETLVGYADRLGLHPRLKTTERLAVVGAAR